MDEVASEGIPNSNSRCGKIEKKIEEMKCCIEEMRLECQRLRESIEHQNIGNRCEPRFASLFVIVCFFAVFIWCLKNGRDSLLELM